MWKRRVLEALLKFVLEPRYEEQDHELPRSARHGHASRRDIHSERHVFEEPTDVATAMIIRACFKAEWMSRACRNQGERISDGSEVEEYISPTSTANSTADKP